MFFKKFVLSHSRVLNAALGYEKPPTRTPDEVQQLANICNVQKQNAKLVGDESSNLYFMQFIQSLKSKTMMVGVVGIFDYNLEVVLIETGHVVKIFYRVRTFLSFKSFLNVTFSFQNLQQHDDIILKTFPDYSPPYCTITQPKLQSVPIRIEFGSEIMAVVEVIKGKIAIKRIFYHLCD